MDKASEVINKHHRRSQSWCAKYYSEGMDGTQSFMNFALESASNPQMSPDKLRLLSTSGFWMIRLAVASNPALEEAERKHILDALWTEVEEALWGPERPLPTFDVLQEDGIRAALDRLDLLPPAQDKRAIAAAAKSPDTLRRIAAILSPGIQPSVLKMLLEDPVNSTKAFAAEKLRALETVAEVQFEHKTLPKQGVTIEK